MRKDRLGILVSALRHNADNPTGAKFDMDNWAMAPGRDLPAIDCGTVVCAFGLAALLPELRDQGLSLVGSGKFRIPIYQGSSGFPAAELFFEIDHEAAVYLFHASSYDDSELTGAMAERAVADRIEAFIQDDQSL